MFSLISTRIVSIANSCDHLKDPIEAKNVYLEASIARKCLLLRLRVIRSVQGQPPIWHVAQIDPRARTQMSKQDNCRKKENQLEQVGPLLLDRVLHAVVDQTAEGCKHFEEVYNAQKLEHVNQIILLYVDHWRNRGCHVKPKVKREVALADVLERTIASVGGEKVQNDFDGPRNVGDPFDPQNVVLELGFPFFHDE